MSKSLKNTLAKRKLAAIMFTDIAGYTRLMQQDENMAKDVRNLHRKALEEETEKRFGEILQYYGDGSLSMYNSSIEAVECAISIQKRLKTKVNLRIGLHVGDIVHDEEGIYGDGVNIASRIESMAIPGSVLISDKLYDDIKNHIDLHTRSLGVFELKNVDKPIEIYALIDDSIVVPEKIDMQGKGEPKEKSIAVLSFTNMSADPDNEYFSDGITEELLNALSKVDGLRVTARISSFAFKGKNMDIREIGKILNVDHIVEGSVRKAGNRVRITAQLINSMDGYHLWSETYDRELEDIFALQDEISKTITSQLRLKLSIKSHQESLVICCTDNLESYSLYLKGKYYCNKWSPETLKIAIGFFQEAIKADPSFSMPYAQIAGCYIFFGMMGINKPEIVFPKALEYANKAMAINENDPSSILSIAMVKFLYERNFLDAAGYFEKALNLDPKYADARLYYSMFLSAKGDLSDALSEVKIALQLDPLSVNINNAIAQAYMHLDQFKEALSHINQTLDIDPEFRMALETRGWIYYHMGELDKSESSFREYQKLTGSEYKGLSGLGFIYGKTGQTKKALKCIKNLEKRQKLGKDTILDIDFATIYLGLDDYEKVFFHLERALKRGVGTLFIKTESIWKKVRKDPRYAKILENH